ncbi:hypothetical protein DSL72_007726 [Monilinia vaccinii-corymbosi]|uniref:Uncharacterized protein n=1 Tax=Monilinia vaccinii-corymbosi TaxID=61207 RepID=A0A8A3PHR0_9HELO|nr:hypothetical protein DSL72_007726 [Monilinia vaccinii-corymbosi]
MDNEVCRGNGAIAQPSTEDLKQLELKAAEEAKAQDTIQALEFDLNLLPIHPALIIFDKNSIGIHIDQCKSSKEKPTNVGTLIKAISAYAPYVQSIDMNIHAPYPYDEPIMVQKRRTRCFQKLFAEINNFKLVSLHLCMILDKDEFPQMKLAAGIMGLSFQDWTLTYEVRGVGVYIPVPRGSGFDLRLRGVFKKEVLPA